MSGDDVVLVFCTAPGSAADGRLGAVELARQLVAEQLCACVNVVPGVRSFFRWAGRVDDADECLLIVKTTAARAVALRERVVALHPYDLPEIIVSPVSDGLPAYLQWVRDAVAPPA